jgi:hypothetical protein
MESRSIRVSAISHDSRCFPPEAFDAREPAHRPQRSRFARVQFDVVVEVPRGSRNKYVIGREGHRGEQPAIKAQAPDAEARSVIDASRARFKAAS